MQKITLKIPLKLNLALDVVGVKDGFHLLETVVTTINVYDTVTLKRRKDNKITLTQRGKRVSCDTTSHSAYKTALIFMQEFNTSGVDIIIKKRVGEGGGLGGSSADIVGVAVAMKILFKLEQCDLVEFVKKLGSDTVYMLKGGFALLTGFGEKVQSFNVLNRLYFNLFLANSSAPCKDVYRLFDQLEHNKLPTANEVIKALIQQDVERAKALAKNDLSSPASSLVSEISDNLKLLGSECVFMSGSGSTLFTIHQTKAERNKLYKKYKKMFGKNIIKAHSLN